MPLLQQLAVAHAALTGALLLLLWSVVLGQAVRRRLRRDDRAAGSLPYPEQHAAAQVHVLPARADRDEEQGAAEPAAPGQGRPGPELRFAYGRGA